MENSCVILDIGSGYSKIGYSGDAEPISIIPTIVGHPKTDTSITSDDISSLKFGQEALDIEDEMEIIHPIQKGQITDWDNYEYFLDHIFKNELKINPEEHNIFITEPPVTQKSIREKLTKLLFDKFNVPSVFVTNGAILSLYGACKYSGFVLDCGYDSTTILPINDGYPYSSCIETIDIGGKDISEYLLELLIKKGNEKKNVKKHIEYIIEKYCYISLDDQEKEKDDDINKKYILPDKTEIELGDERFLASEILFHPEIVRKTVGGIANTLCSCISSIDHFINCKFDTKSLIISGGPTLLEGFSDRLSKEIKRYYGGKYKDRINIIEIKERRYLQWIGASIYSLMQIFKGLCTSKEEYKEYGVSTIHSKCFY